MGSSKRPRSGDRDDEIEHVNKKIANLDEGTLCEQATPNARSSDKTEVELRGLMSDVQGTEVCEAASDGPVESHQDTKTLTTNTGHAIEAHHSTPASYGDDKELKRRLTILEISLITQHGVEKSANKQDKLKHQVKALKSKLKATQHELEAEKQKLEATNLRRVAEKEKREAGQEMLRVEKEKREAVEKLWESAKDHIKQLTEDIELAGIAQQSAPDLDSILEHQFRILRRTIRSFARAYCGRRITLASLPTDLSEVVPYLSGVPASQLLKSHLHARYFVESVIWFTLFIEFLKNPFAIWGNNPTIGLVAETIQQNSKIASPSRQLWRTMTGQHLDSSMSPATSKIERLKNLLVSDISPLVKNEHKDHINNLVAPIVEQTVELARILSQSRTLFAVQRRDPAATKGEPLKYKNTWMEIVEKGIRHPGKIDLLVTPALIQLTNSAGDEFSPPRVIVKAEVCFGEEGRTGASPPTTPNPPARSRVKITSSGRQSHGVQRYGPSAEEADVEDAIGVDDDEDYQDDASAASSQRKGSRRN
ncbi:hypothetical protein F5Y03DRAFT_397621 [Xylaria venustula]|nr:hypothetical protein F5Y03DRAFT_397621 [Xylaria venustula]